ncbi:AGC protein kinase [Elysia marginata]|uniref:mitogen-activated protein kinase kinase n=1 Tax=Elysia marginata TaxID=1093978 RepID=A0AAV4JAP3_9GAST|nr:AGC protein kinase [Elysia marginata]
MEEDNDDETCLTTLCLFPTKKKTPDAENSDLDGFMRFMQRKEPNSNPALRGDLSMVSTNAMRAEARQGNKTKAEGNRDDRATNIHVVEELYYNVVGRSAAEPTAFKGIKLNMARGSCSQVHLLQHIASGYMGVMKIVPPNRHFNAATELNILADCSDSPFILQLIDAFASERTSYIFVEYAPFRSLDDLAQVTDGVGSEKCMLFALEILLAIQHLHRRRILHRDIKPENVFLLISGHVKLGDFSASTYLDAKSAKTRGFCCTYVTRPPEVDVTLVSPLLVVKPEPTFHRIYMS